MAKKILRKRKLAGGRGSDLANVPFGLKLISILYYVGAILSWISALMFLIIGVAVLINPDVVVKFQNLTESLSTTLGFGGSILGILLLLFGIIIVGVGILDFFIAKGLIRKKRWTRTIVVIFSALGFLSSLVYLIGGDWSQVFGLIVSGLIGWYLIFNQSVKKFFR